MRRLRPLIRLPASWPLTPAALRGFHALTIDHACRRRHRAPFGQTRRCDAPEVQLFQQTVVAPAVEGAPHHPRPGECRPVASAPGSRWSPRRRPVVAMWRIASTTSRRSVVRGRPILLGAGISGAISARSASPASLAYLPPLRPYRRRVNSVQAMGISVPSRKRTESQVAGFTQLISD